jgi:REP element-mobilizing transposase RayT
VNIIDTVFDHCEELNLGNIGIQIGCSLFPKHVHCLFEYQTQDLLTDNLLLLLTATIPHIFEVGIQHLDHEVYLLRESKARILILDLLCINSCHQLVPAVLGHRYVFTSVS